MALSETFYAVHAEYSGIPDQSDWYTESVSAREDAVVDAENSSGVVYVVTEISLKPILKTVATITIEEI